MGIEKRNHSHRFPTPLYRHFIRSADRSRIPLDFASKSSKFRTQHYFDYAIKKKNQQNDFCFSQALEFSGFDAIVATSGEIYSKTLYWNSESAQ